MRRFRITPVRLASAIAVGSLACAGVAYAASLGLASNKLHAWSQTLTKGTCNQTSTTADDTYVQQALPTSTAGGTATTLTISPLSGAQDYAFIRFDLSGCSLPTTAGADTSTLTVVVTTSSTHTPCTKRTGPGGRSSCEPPPRKLSRQRSRIRKSQRHSFRPIAATCSTSISGN